MKMYVLMKDTFVDEKVSEPVAVSESKEALETAASEMNLRRTSEDIRRGITYRVLPDPVRVL